MIFRIVLPKYFLTFRLGGELNLNIRTCSLFALFGNYNDNVKQHERPSTRTERPVKQYDYIVCYEQDSKKVEKCIKCIYLFDLINFISFF